MDPIVEQSVMDMPAEFEPSSPRSRLKEEILQRVTNYVKAIFLLRCCSLSQDEFVLTNEDNHAHSLVEALDSVFFHGLKAPQHGYWALAQELCHATVVADIKGFEKVTSDMGRGRAWLYVSLNDHLLESYLRHLTENTEIANKFYSKGSFLCDLPLVHSLQSLTSGLENVRFELNGNLLFLDISFPKRTGRSETESSEDLPRDMSHMTASTASTDSGCSQASADTAESYDCSRDNPFLHPPRNRLAKVKALFKSSRPAVVVGERPSMEATAPRSISRRGSSIDLLRKPGKTFDVEVPATDEPMEWTAVRPKRRAPKKKKARRRSLASSAPSTSVSGDSTPESGYKSSFVDNIEASRLHEAQEVSLRDVVDRLGGLGMDEDAVLAHILSKDVEPEEKKEKVTENIVAAAPEKEERVEQCAQIEFVREISIYDRVRSPHDSDATLTLAEDSSTTLEDSGSHAFLSSCNEPSLAAPPLAPSAEAPVTSAEPLGTSALPVAPSTQPLLSQVSSYESFMDSIGDNMLTIKPTDRFARMEDNFNHPSISKDNNLMLMLMLGVSDDPNEQMVKLFEVSIGITEGHHLARHLIVSTSRLYIVEVECLTKFRFRLESTIPFQNVDYISLSINFQTVSIICHNWHEKFWINAGDQMLSWYLAQTIQEAYSKEELGLGKLCVLVDASIQRIAMKKWVSQENKEDVEAHLLSYTLLHWEEVNQKTLDLPQVNCTGLLKMRKPQGWHLSFYELKENILHEYCDSQTTDALVRSYPINSSNVIKCSRTAFSISNCFEIKLAGNTKCEFASVSQEEMAEWIELLHLAMKQPARAETLPCCCVITPKDVLLCHEDQQTNFFRSLASLSFLDLMCILVHEELPNCCVLEIELKGDINHWIFHLTSTTERDRFTAGLAYGWRGNFMVPIDVKRMDNAALKRWCIKSANTITKKWKPEIYNPDDCSLQS